MFDASGLNLYPGFVEAHCHIGLHGYGIGYEGADYNEMNDTLVPQLRAIDGIEPTDPTFLQAARAGVTTVCTGPLGERDRRHLCCAQDHRHPGRRYGRARRRGDEMRFSGNRKRCYREKGVSTRMTTAAKIREMLLRARDYKQKKDAGKDVAFDIKLEALLPVLEGKMPLKAHAH